MIGFHLIFDITNTKSTAKYHIKNINACFSISAGTDWRAAQYLAFTQK